MHGSTHTALEQHIHDGRDGEHTRRLVLVKADEALVGILDTGSGDGTIDNEHEVMVVIILLIEFAQHLAVNTTLHAGSDGQQATLVSHIDSQVNGLIKAGLASLQVVQQFLALLAGPL